MGGAGRALGDGRQVGLVGGRQGQDRVGRPGQGAHRPARGPAQHPGAPGAQGGGVVGLVIGPLQLAPRAHDQNGGGGDPAQCGGGQADDLVEAAGEAQGRQEPLQGLHVDAGGVHAVGQDGGPGCGRGAGCGVVPGPGCGVVPGPGGAPGAGPDPSGQYEDLGPERGGRPARQVQGGAAGLVVSTHSR